MSNELQISRTLVIKSPQQFYKYLTSIEYKNNKLVPFVDRIELFINGCSCDADSNWEKTIIEYNKISEYDINDIKEKIGCDKIDFYLDNNLLFSK